MTNGIAGTSLTDVADEIGRGSISAVEVTRHQLDRIDTCEPDLGAFVTVLAEDALAEAEQRDRWRAEGGAIGPLHGVPIAVKDLLFTKGVPTTAGSPVFRDFVSDEDATVVKRLRDAGAVIIGKTKLTEGAFSVHHPDVAPPINPWNADYWTGVSSSGSGVAVAAGLAYGATGSDTGGSIRFPSSCCGLVGIKPTYGLVSRHGAFALAESLDHMGPMTRTVADAARMLTAMAGHDPMDPTSIRKDREDYASAVDRPVARFRVGIDRSYVENGVDPRVVGAVIDSVDVLRSCGASVVEITLPDVDQLADGWGVTTSVECAMAHAPYFDSRRGDYGPVLSRLIEVGRTVAAQDYAELERARERFRADLDEVFESVDVVVSPVMAAPTPTLVQVAALLAEPDAGGAFVRFTAPYDYSGHPTITLPTSRRAEVPLGFQLIGRHLGESDLIRAASAYEREVGFTHPIED